MQASKIISRIPWRNVLILCAVSLVLVSSIQTFFRMATWFGLRWLLHVIPAVVASVFLLPIGSFGVTPKTHAFMAGAATILSWVSLAGYYIYSRTKNDPSEIAFHIFRPDWNAFTTKEKAKAFHFICGWIYCLLLTFNSLSGIGKYFGSRFFKNFGNTHVFIGRLSIYLGIVTSAQTTWWYGLPKAWVVSSNWPNHVFYILYSLISAVMCLCVFLLPRLSKSSSGLKPTFGKQVAPI